jgi:hypothetical protein
MVGGQTEGNKEERSIVWRFSPKVRDFGWCMYVHTCMVISSLNTFLLKASDFYMVYVEMINLVSPKLVLFTRRKYQKRG